MERGTRKQHELAVREDLILNIARDMLLHVGYHGLTMARIAEAASCAKGTVYLHFACKEELIVALVARGVAKRVVMMRRAASLPGTPRERLVAVGEAFELFNHLHPDDVRLFYASNTAAIIQKASDASLGEMRVHTRDTLQVVAGIVRDAVKCGDLQLPRGITPERLTFSLRAIYDGAYASASSWMRPEEMGVFDSWTAVNEACDRLCDGYGWRPLLSECDYGEVRRRVREALLAAETTQAIAVRNADRQGSFDAVAHGRRAY